MVLDFGRVISAPKPESLFRGYERMLGLPSGTINRIMFEDPLWEEALLGRITLDEYWRGIGPKLNLYGRGAVQAFRRRYEADERLNEDVAEILKALHGKVRLAVLSNAPKGLEEWLRKWDLLPLFDDVFCSANEGIRKPFPEAYRRLLKRLRVEPEETFFVDDAEENILAAQALGIQAHLYDGPDHLEKTLIGLGLLP